MFLVEVEYEEEVGDVGDSGDGGTRGVDDADDEEEVIHCTDDNPRGGEGDYIGKPVFKEHTRKD
jgi:hypothetical protein